MARKPLVTMVLAGRCPVAAASASSAAAVILMCAVLMLAQCPSSQAQGGNCTDATDCAACLDTAPRCQWCSDLTEMYQTAMPRCSASFTNCSNITNITSGDPVFTKAQQLGPDVQLTPEQVEVEMRSGDIVEFDIRVRPALNYPLDVYYLMDHTLSFSKDLDSLRMNAAGISAVINRISTRSRLGFGAFVDKPAEPYAYQVDNVAIPMCAGCEAPYSFENTLPLTNDSSAFARILQSQNVTRNIDDQEGILDAIMQTLVCDREIGWRQDAQRVLVVATNADFHSAGDGRVAGIVLPNDGNCHLDGTGRYTEGLKYDYPSIGQINSVVQETNTIVVFAVKLEAMPAYQNVTPEIQRAELIELQKTSTNVDRLLTRVLARLVSQALPIILTEEGVRIRSVRATCQTPNPKSKITGSNLEGCIDQRPGRVMVFRVQLEAGSCREMTAGQGRAVLRFNAFGDVEIKVNGLCNCPCNNSAAVSNSSWCSNQGSEQCGLCTCLDGFENRTPLSRCDCDVKVIEPCIQPGSGTICSGRGVCRCKECVCKALSNGTYCECDNGDCETGSNGLICSGSGVCECGTCRCSPGFVGEACDCATSDDPCKKSADGDNDRLCSGQGMCECGRCTCLNGFGGPFCDMCISTPELCARSICLASLSCVDLLKASTPASERAALLTRCTALPIMLSGNVTEPHTINGLNATSCPFLDEDQCSRKYYVVPKGASSAVERVFLPLEIGFDRACPLTSGGGSSFNYLPMIIGIVVGLLFIGIVSLLIWRYFTSKKDQQEYNQFLNSTKDTDWSNSENPLYKNATQKFTNPTFTTVPK